MRIVVSTPTGNIGSGVTDRLLQADADVLLIHRDTSRLESLAARGASLAQGSLEDEAFVAAATAGADALFWVTPLDPRAENLRASQNAFGVAAAAAVEANRIGRVINVSSVGAQHDAGTGPVAGLHDIEEMFGVTGADVLNLRPAFFYENYMPQVQAIKAMGGIMMPVSGSRSIPMIATRDIAAVAAERLLDEGWTGSSVLGLHGPVDRSFDEAAEIISRAVGKDIPHIAIDEMQARMGLSMMGLGQGVIDALIELYQAIDSGHLDPAEPRSEETTTPTELEQWATEVIAPMLAGPVASG